MKNWFYLLIAIIILFIVVRIIGYKRTERLKNKLNELQEERQKLWNEIQQRECLRNYLNRKLNIHARLASIIIFSIFIVASIIVGFWSADQINLSATFNGVLFVEGIILIISQLAIHKPHEIRYYLGQVKPYLKDKIFANHKKLDEEIEGGHKRIAIIDVQIQRLQRMIAA